MKVQLAFEFPLVEDDVLETIPTAAREFVSGVSRVDYSGKRFRWGTKNDNTLEMYFPQYRRAYHTKDAAARFNAEMKQYVELFFKKATLKNRSSIRHVAHPNEFAWTPAYFKIHHDPETKRIAVDYSSFCYSRDNKGAVNRDAPPISSVWIHTEYVHLKQEDRHRVDVDNSYVVSSFDGNGIFVAKINETEKFHLDLFSMFPWSVFGNFNSSDKGGWYKDAVKEVSDLIGKVFKPGFKGNIANMMYAVRDHWSNDSQYIRIVSAMVATNDGKEFLRRVIAETDSNMVGKVYPAFAEHGLRLLKGYMEASATQAEIDKDKPHWQRRNGNQVWERWLLYLQMVAEICQHYEEPTIVRLLPDDVFSANHPFQMNNGYGYQNMPSHMHQILNDPTFQRFPRSKQYRVLASIFTTERGLQNGLDTCNMLQLLHQHDEVYELDHRDIKDIHSFHDQVIPAYNNVRHKPKVIHAGFTEWITSYNEMLPDSTLKCVAPKDTNEIRTWGQRQGHCIGSYADSMADGNTTVLGFWDTEKEDWLGHIQIRVPVTSKGPGKWQPNPQYQRHYDDLDSLNVIQVQQFYGKHNSRIDQTIHHQVLAYLNQALAAWIKKLREEEAAKAAEKANEAVPALASS